MTLKCLKRGVVGSTARSQMFDESRRALSESRLYTLTVCVLVSHWFVFMQWMQPFGVIHSSLCYFSLFISLCISRWIWQSGLLGVLASFVILSKITLNRWATWLYTKWIATESGILYEPLQFVSYIPFLRSTSKIRKVSHRSTFVQQTHAVKVCRPHKFWCNSMSKRKTKTSNPRNEAQIFVQSWL